MKVYLESIEVVSHDGLPQRIRWRRDVHTVVMIADAWTFAGRWWATEIHRQYFRVITDRSVLEVFRSGEQWRLSRVVD